jgi:hypothetical protein
MKRILFDFCALLLLNQYSYAQDSDQKLEFGLGISPAFSWVNPTTKMVKSGGSTLKFGFGARLNFMLSSKYALGFEFNLQNWGAKTHFDKINVEQKGVTKTSSDFNMDYKLRYMEIPVLLKMRTETKNNIAYYGEFGGNIGWLLSQLADIESDELSLEQVNTKNPEDGDEFKLFNADNGTTEYDYAINSLKIGLIFGGGIHYHLDNNSKVELGLRYHLGLTDIYNEAKWQGTNHALALNLGFIF